MNNHHRFNQLMSSFRGEGPYLFVDGKKMFDAASGTFNLALGYNHPTLVARLQQQLERCSHLSSRFTHDASQLLFERLKPYLPAGMERFWFRDITGSSAIEGAIRMAQKASGRSGVISFYRAHHGQSLATASISGNAFRLSHFHTVIEGSLKIPAPASLYCGVSASAPIELPDFEQYIEYASTDNIACIVIEPVQGNGGNIVFPPAFYSALREVASRHNIAIIADEVQTGFGRTGSFFASSGYAAALQPDILVFAKGAGGIGIPAAGICMRPEYDVLESFEHSSTSGANPLALTALDATISVIEEEGVLDNVEALQPHLEAGLLELQQRYSGFMSGARGIGFMYAFDLPTVESVDLFIEIAERHQLIVRSARYGRSNTVKVRPALISTQQDIDVLLHALDASLAEFVATCPQLEGVA
ncbi:5-aminovalerate aminotransferase DavT [Carnimonas sp. R-84865]